MSEKLIAGFLKVRNGVLRGDLYQVLLNMEQYVDDLFVCSDASFDGTTEILQEIVPEDQLLIISHEEHDFANEIAIKQRMLDMVHAKGPYSYIFWMDSDEVLDANGTENLRQFCKDNWTKTSVQAWSFHYTQFWRNTNYARTDDGFDDGHFIKLWRYQENLSFDVQMGTHMPQFPKQILIAHAKNPEAVQPAPFELLHYGNVGQNLKFKALQYYGGLGGVERHLQYGEEATYREVPQDLIPKGAAVVPGDKPEPFTEKQQVLTLQMKNWKQLEGHFAVTISAYNRADTLPRALDSLIAQTYEDWSCVVVDDGSTDNTQAVMAEYCDRDPRIFYARYLDHKGGVAANEKGMEIAIHTGQWWTRLGSDDFFLPHKLETDVKAFKEGHLAVYSPFCAYRNNEFAEPGNWPVPADRMREGFLRGGFFASWANMAVSTHILKEVKKKYGDYVYQGEFNTQEFGKLKLVNMEDLLFNYRVSTLTSWIFVMKFKDSYIINPDLDTMQAIMEKRIDLEVGGVWNVNPNGASGNQDLYNRDSALSRALIAYEEGKYK